MKPLLEDIKQELKAKNIYLSHQRLKVLECLIQNHCHPTAEELFIGLHKDMPTLSKTTVYNTLRILAESDLVRTITIEGNESRYDIVTGDHGHFKCGSCGMIFDFPIDFDSLLTKELSGFKIIEKNIYFKGLCPECISYKQKIK